MVQHQQQREFAAWADVEAGVRWLATEAIPGLDALELLVHRPGERELARIRVEADEVAVTAAQLEHGLGSLQLPHERWIVADVHDRRPFLSEPVDGSGRVAHRRIVRVTCRAAARGEA